MATFVSFSTRLVERWHTLNPAWRWTLGVYAAARLGYALWGLVVMFVVPAVMQNLDLNGEPVLAFFDMPSGDRYVYSRQVGERVLDFRRQSDGTLADVETGSIWDLESGRAIAGTLVGQALQAAAVTTEDVFPYHGVQPERGVWSVWQRFDVLWYQAIAERGYAATPNAIHFPPLYPMLESLFGRLLGGRYFFAGWLISQVALVWALALLYGLTERWRGQSSAGRAVIFAVLFPTAFFFFTAYSESLFLLLTLLCLAALEREQWLWAGVCALLAILTRLQGVALLVPFVYCAWRVLKVNRRAIQVWVMLALPFLAIGFYVALRAWVGDGNVVPTSEPQLGARLALPWENVLSAIQTLTSGRFLMADVLNLVATILALAILARGWSLLPITFALYCAATILVMMLRYVDTQPLNSMTRYMLTLFPLLMLLAYWSKNRWVERAVVYVSVPLALYLSAQFMTWGWVA